MTAIALCHKAPAAPGLAHPEQVSGQVVNLLEPVPVLERVGERLGGGIASLFEAVRGRQCPAQPGLGVADELLELRSDAGSTGIRRVHRVVCAHLTAVRLAGPLHA